MKHFLIILSFFLSCLFGNGKVDTIDRCAKLSASVVETARQDRSDKSPNCYSQAILPVQTARFSTENTSVTPSVRSNSSGRRTQVSQKYPFRIVKAGKIIDRNNFYIYQSELRQFQTGIHSISRYIYTIRHLLI